MPQKPASERVPASNEKAGVQASKKNELSLEELDQISGGLKKLPGKKKPPTLTLG